MTCGGEIRAGSPELSSVTRGKYPIDGGPSGETSPLAAVVPW